MTARKLIRCRGALISASSCAAPRAVVLPGARPISDAWAREHGLSLAAPVILKYRDERTDAATVLEEALR